MRSKLSATVPLWPRPDWDAAAGTGGGNAQAATRFGAREERGVVKASDIGVRRRVARESEWSDVLQSY